MEHNHHVLCPICEKGKFHITSERTGPQGFRTTDYDLVSKTCDCVSTLNNEDILYTLAYEGNSSKIKADLCEDCHNEVPKIHFPLKSWAGIYKDICISCFAKEVS